MLARIQATVGELAHFAAGSAMGLAWRHERLEEVALPLGAADENELALRG